MAGSDRQRMIGLATLDRDSRPRPHACAEGGFDIHEMFLSSAVDSLDKLAALVGSPMDESRHTFGLGDLGDGSSEVSVEFERNANPWRERLAAIIGWAWEMAPKGVDPREFARRCLWVDGWTLAMGSLKTPIWMELEEFDLSDLALEIEEVAWLCE